jgi:ATP-binding cassette, subfamily B, bacterial
MGLSLQTRLRRVGVARERARFALGPLLRLVLPLGGLSVLAGVFEAGVLALMAEVAFSMAQGDSSSSFELGPIAFDATVPQLLGVAVVFAILRLAMQWWLAYMTARMSASAQSRLMRKLFHAYTRGSWEVQSRDGEGHLQEMMASHTRSATQAAMIVAGAVAPLSSFLILVGSAVVLSPVIALAIAAAAVGIFFVLRPFGRMGRRHAALHSSGSLALADGVGEAVRLTEEMHVYGTAAQHRERIDRLVHDVETPFFHTQLLAMGVPALHQGLALVLVIGGLSALYAVGGENLGALGAIVLILVRALSYGQQLQSAYQKLNDVSPFLDRVVKEVGRYAGSEQRSGTLPVPPRSAISFDRVSFAYDDRQGVLHDVSFHVEAGETIGIVGLSGAGKSTLVQLLLRLREPDAGVFRLGGIDVRDLALDDWQRRVAYVSQEPRLLGGSVAENIRYFRERPPGWPTPRRRVGRPAPAAVPGPGTGRPARDPGAGRADERARPAVRGGDPALARGTAGRRDHVHRRPPHVDAQHLRPHHGGRVGPHRGVRHAGEPPAGRRVLPGGLGAGRREHEFRFVVTRATLVRASGRTRR